MTIEEFLAQWNDTSDVIEVHTSGSTGKPKRLLVEKRRMVNSARITCDFLGLKEGDTALLCMPLDYIAGKMVVVRSLVSHLHLISVMPSSHPLKDVTQPIDFAAMVPLQVYSSMQEPAERERLLSIRHLIIGGGAIDDSLESQLQQFPNAVWSTYGMTETLSHIALRRISGENSSLWYSPLDGVDVSLSSDSCLEIYAPQVNPEKLHTNDIAELRTLPDGSKEFRILGRKDNVIDSGGIKIQAEEVERLLRPHLSCGFMITKVSDARLGEAVTILIESDDAYSTLSICKHVLPKHWVPRHVLPISHIPLTETGKPARAEAEALAKKLLHSI
ncbi:MAG: AMP-binding protein [Prevotella sp.]|nr:AMP-binding protein [Prevotellaceae bacterium]MDY5343052.1 AMP-binding protein [Prevotella sp.]